MRSEWMKSGWMRSGWMRSGWMEQGYKDNSTWNPDLNVVFLSSSTDKNKEAPSPSSIIPSHILASPTPPVVSPAEGQSKSSAIQFNQSASRVQFCNNRDSEAHVNCCSVVEFFSTAETSQELKELEGLVPSVCVPTQCVHMGLQQDEDLEACLAVAIDVAQKAGQVILNNFHGAKHVEHKGMVDLVTETDRACEDLIFTQLKLSFPSHELIGEETSAENGTPELMDVPTWVVDPLDGTTNFVHKFPFVCVSIALVINKVPVVGVVYNPIMGELFTAIQGKGAHLNGQRIWASSQNNIGNAILATEVGTKRDKKTVDRTTKMINNLLFQVRSIRLSGSCAMNLCGVACGRLDMFYELGFGGPWDVAGGALIVKEAGGHVFDPSGGDFDLMANRVASSNAHLKEALVAGIAGYV